MVALLFPTALNIGWTNREEGNCQNQDHPEDKIRIALSLTDPPTNNGFLLDIFKMAGENEKLYISKSPPTQSVTDHLTWKHQVENN